MHAAVRVFDAGALAHSQETTMSQWSLQLVIGKLLTDQQFRQEFVERGRDCLAGLSERGIQLMPGEIDALVAVDSRIWARTARKMAGLLDAAAPRSNTPERPLTRREQQVLRAVFEGLTNKQIAAELHVSEGAIKATLQQLFRKAHVRTRAQLVRVAVEGSLATPKTRRHTQHASS